MARSPMVWRRSMWLSTCTGRVRGWQCMTAVTLVMAMVPGAVGRAQSTAGSSGLGRAPTEAELRDSLVGPDGQELPEGTGVAADGGIVFARRGCATCHGPTGSEGPAVALVGGEVTTRTNYWPILHWPHAPSIWDYIRRAMPYDRPGTLTVDEVYAVTAFLLYRNGIIEEDDVMDARRLPMVQMPHRAEYVVPEPWTPQTPRGFEIVPAR